MKLKIRILFLFIPMALLFTSCSPNIVGTWNVEKFETSVEGQTGTSLSNIGTFTFKRNGSGEKSLNYFVLGLQRDDNVPFKWTWDSKSYITIESQGSEFSKTWILIENKKKSQVWKSTDGSNTVHELVLKK